MFVAGIGLGAAKTPAAADAGNQDHSALKHLCIQMDFCLFCKGSEKQSTSLMELIRGRGSLDRGELVSWGEGKGKLLKIISKAECRPTRVRVCLHRVPLQIQTHRQSYMFMPPHTCPYACAHVRAYTQRTDIT